jgi:hypothetical protein
VGARRYHPPAAATVRTAAAAQHRSTVQEGSVITTTSTAAYWAVILTLDDERPRVVGVSYQPADVEQIAGRFAAAFPDALVEISGPPPERVWRRFQQ